MSRKTLFDDEEDHSADLARARMAATILPEPELLPQQQTNQEPEDESSEDEGEIFLARLESKKQEKRAALLKKKLEAEARKVLEKAQKEKVSEAKNPLKASSASIKKVAEPAKKASGKNEPPKKEEKPKVVVADPPKQEGPVRRTVPRSVSKPLVRSRVGGALETAEAKILGHK